MTRASFLLVIVAFALYIPILEAQTVQETPPQVESHKLAATWRPTLMVVNGQPISPPPGTYSFNDARMTIRNKGYAAVTMEYLIGTQPRHLDVTARLPDGPQISRMLYEVDKDLLRICYPQPGGSRPTKLTSLRGSGWTYLEFERVVADE